MISVNKNEADRTDFFGNKPTSKINESRLEKKTATAVQT